MTVSEITAQNVADYLRLSEYTQGDEDFITTSIDIAKDYISNYTGLASEDLDECQDLVIVVYVLCQDMYDTRSLYVDNNNVNEVVATILGMHARNLL